MKANLAFFIISTLLAGVSILGIMNGRPQHLFTYFTMLILAIVFLNKYLKAKSKERKKYFNH